MYQAAISNGIECVLFGDHETIQMTSGSKTWYTRGSRTSLQSSVGFTIAQLKHLTKAVLAHHQLPTARFIEVRTTTDLTKLDQLTFPVVMKPIAGQHGRSVVVGIINAAAAKAEFESYQKPVLFEEQLTGTEYRVVCVDYTFVAAAYRKPAFVIGDGVRNIKELVAIKNQHPWRGTGHTSPLTIIEIDETVQKNLLEQQLNPSSVPSMNQEVFLRKTNNLSTGGEPHDVSELVHPENRLLFEKIARACDLNTLGIDFMCQDISQPLSQQSSYGVIEVNASPGLRMHHYPLHGKPQDVAGAILQLCLNN